MARTTDKPSPADIITNAIIDKLESGVRPWVKPRLRTVDGLWRKPVLGRLGATPRPGSITEFIRERGLLPPAEIDHIIATAPTAAPSGGTGGRAPWGGGRGALTRPRSPAASSMPARLRRPARSSSRRSRNTRLTASAGLPLVGG